MDLHYNGNACKTDLEIQPIQDDELGTWVESVPVVAEIIAKCLLVINPLIWNSGLLTGLRFSFLQNLEQKELRLTKHTFPIQKT